MKPSSVLQAHRDDVRRIVLSHRALNPRIFGSVLHGADWIDPDIVWRTVKQDLPALRQQVEPLLDSL